MINWMAILPYAIGFVFLLGLFYFTYKPKHSKEQVKVMREEYDQEFQDVLRRLEHEHVLDHRTNLLLLVELLQKIPNQEACFNYLIDAEHLYYLGCFYDAEHEEMFLTTNIQDIEMQGLLTDKEIAAFEDEGWEFNVNTYDMKMPASNNDEIVAKLCKALHLLGCTQAGSIEVDSFLAG